MRRSARQAAADSELENGSEAGSGNASAAGSDDGGVAAAVELENGPDVGSENESVAGSAGGIAAAAAGGVAVGDESDGSDANSVWG